MAREVEMGRRSPWRILGWGTAVLLLVAPFVAMQITSEVNWTVGDFIFGALMFGSVGVISELTARSSRSTAYRGGVGAALAAGFLTIWVNGAVGMIGDEGNPYNLLFLGVVALALVGAAIVRFRPSGMAFTMSAAAIAHGAVALGGVPADLRGGILSACLAGLWLLSATLFRKASREP